MANKIYKKRTIFNHKQYNQSLQYTVDMALKNVIVEEQCPTVADILESTIGTYINISKNNCRYSGTA